MKTVATILSMILLLPMYAYAQRLINFQCDPISCQESFGPITTGDVGVNAYGTCLNYIGDVQVNVAVQAQGCFLQVVLAADARKTSQELLDDCGLPFITEGIRGDAGAFFASDLHLFWQMYQEVDCAGVDDRYVQPGSPC